MLTALDETFLHQVALPFDLCASSDHRFFDRTVITAASKDGAVGVILGMGVYKNMDVMDGFAAVQSGLSQQRNLRLSRQLRPDLSATLGPLRFEVIEPFRKLRYVLEEGHAPFHFDLTFEAFMEPGLEDPHFHRTGGRITQDYLRFNQLLSASGQIVIEGHRHDAAAWFGWRDHSWGVRPGVGGFEPPVPGVTDAFPSAARAGGKGMVLFYVAFNIDDELGGGVQVIENGLGEPIYLTGHIGPRGGKLSPVKQYDWSVELFSGTRAPKILRITAFTEDGATYEIIAEPIGRSWAYRGFGYDAGYNDKRGQGIWRSQDVTAEQDIYDISDVEEVILADGSKIRPNHRETAIRATVNGKEGRGYMPFVAIGDVAKLRSGNE